MRDFFTPSKVRNLPESEVVIIEQRASEGDPVACYKLAQILLAWRDTDDYLDQVDPLLTAAADGGVIDAYVAKAAILCEEGPPKRQQDFKGLQDRGASCSFKGVHLCCPASWRPCNSYREGR